MEGPLNNLQPSMIQFSKPKRTLNAAMEPFKRFETPGGDMMGGMPERQSTDLPQLPILTLASRSTRTGGTDTS